MKCKALALILTLILVLGVTGCGSSQAPSSSSAAPQEQPSSQPAAESSAAESAAPTAEVPSYEKPKFLAIGTAAAGGAYYPIGISMADLITNQLGIQTTAQVTGGAIENNTLIQDKTVDIAITMSNSAYDAYNGQGAYTAPSDNLMAMFSGLSYGAFHVVVLDNSGIESMADLKGKRVVMGPAGGGAITVAQSIWKEYGFSIDDVQATYISYSDGISSLKDGNCDAVVVQSAAPAAAIKEMEAGGTAFRLISIEDDMVDKILTEHPYFAAMDMGTDVYNTTRPAKIIYVPTMVVCRADLPEGLVYEITKLFFEQVETIRQSNPSAKEMNIETAANCSIEIHPGAQRYFKEVGVL